MKHLNRLSLLFIATISIATALVAVPAHADYWPGPSGACTNGFGDEINLTDAPVALSVEASPNYYGETRVLVCWRVIPDGTTEWAGGNLYISHFESDGTIRVLCEADRPSTVVFAADCGGRLTPHDPNPASQGMTFDGSVGVLGTTPTYVGETGAEAGSVTYTTSSATYETKQTGTCLYVLGAQLLPGCNTLTTNVWTANGDLPSTGTNGAQCLVGTSSTCQLWIDRNYVVTGSDTTQNTVSGTLLGEGIWLLDIPATCLGFCP